MSSHIFEMRKKFYLENPKEELIQVYIRAYY
jgi:hypothetical protein